MNKKPLNVRLLKACAVGDEAAVRDAVEDDGADVDGVESVRIEGVEGQEPYQNTSWCPIFLATVTGQTRIVALLLSYHVEVDIPNSRAESPLTIASTKGFDDIVCLLLEAGATANTKYTIYPALYCACRRREGGEGARYIYKTAVHIFHVFVCVCVF